MSLGLLTELLSLKGILGADLLNEGLGQSNSFLPILAVLGVWLVGGRFLRLASSLIPITIMVLLMLGHDRGVAKLVGYNSPNMDSTLGPVSSSLLQQGWFLPALVLLGIYFLGRGRLSLLQIGIGAAVTAYLLGSKDFRLNTLLTAPGGHVIMLIVGALIVSCLFFSFLSGRGRYRVAVPLGVQLASLSPLVKYAAIGLTGLFGIFLLFEPLLIDQTFPEWRSTFGIGMLAIALFALSQSLPARFRVWMMPVFWGTVSLVIAVQLASGKPQLVERANPNARAIERF